MLGQVTDLPLGYTFVTTPPTLPSQVTVTSACCHWQALPPSHGAYPAGLLGFPAGVAVCRSR